MCTVLIVFLLVIESTATQPAGQPAAGPGDTVQFCWNERGAWRIRSHALDNQLQVEALPQLSADAVEVLAERETRERHGELIGRKVTVIGADGLSSLQGRLELRGWRGTVSSPPGAAYAYWVPGPRR